jgi:hypothetical protein
MDVIWPFLGVIGALLLKTAVDDLKAWRPWLVERLIARNVAKAPESYRSRLGEEWRAEVDKIPGDIGKIIFAAGLLRAGWHVPPASVGVEKVELSLIQSGQDVKIEVPTAGLPFSWLNISDAAAMSAVMAHHRHRQANIAAIAAAASFTDVSSGTSLTHHSHCIRAQALGGRPVP